MRRRERSRSREKLTNNITQINFNTTSKMIKHSVYISYIKHDTCDEKKNVIEKTHEFYMTCVKLFPSITLKDIVRHLKFDDTEIIIDPKKIQHYESKKQKKYNITVAAMISFCKKLNNGMNNHDACAALSNFLKLLTADLAQKIQVDLSIVREWFATTKNADEDINMEHVEKYITNMHQNKMYFIDTFLKSSKN